MRDLYNRFYMKLLRGLRARIELGETELFDGIKYFLVIKLPFPQ
jgi:hypothetical protein